MFKSILLPIDLGADTSWQKALPVALDMARNNDAELHVVSVLPDFGMSIVGSYFSEDFERNALDDFGQKLKDWVRDNIPDDVKAQGHVLHGSIYAEILQAADKYETDLIVISAHRPELGDYLIGPNAARVVRHADQTVIVVRE